jgi:hypothetical protein
MTFYPRHSDGFKADAEGVLKSNDMEQLLLYCSMLDKRLAQTKAEHAVVDAEIRNAANVRAQQDAAAVAPQVPPQAIASPMVQEAVNLGGTLISQEPMEGLTDNGVAPARCPDHPDRDPRPSNYGGVYCTAKLAAPIQVTRPDGSVKMSEFCIWKHKA